MKQIIRLTESDLNKIVEEAVRRSIKEGTVNEYGMKDFGKDMLGLGLGAGAFGGAVAGNAYLHSDEPEIDPQQAEINQTVKDELGQDVLSPRGSMPSDTISWEKANQFEGKISKAITESIYNFINELSTDTIDAASDKASKKYFNAIATYGDNNPRTRRAKEQYRKFANAWNDEYIKGNDARKARMDKNKEDRASGGRTYQNGVGWRTKQA